MPLQAEVEKSCSGSKQQPGRKQDSGSISMPGLRRKPGSKASLLGSGQKKRKTCKVQQRGTEGNELSAGHADGRSARKQVRFADNAEDETPATDAPLHAKGIRRADDPSSPVAGMQTVEEQDVLGADMAANLAAGASDLADTWEVPNTYPIAPDGCEVVPGIQPPASLVMPPAKPEPDSAEPKHAHCVTAAPASFAAAQMAPAAAYRSKRQLSSRPGHAQQCGSDGAGAGAAVDNDDFQEAPRRVCSRLERRRDARPDATGKALQLKDQDSLGARGGMGKQEQRRRRGVAERRRLDMKRNGVEQKSSRRAHSIAERPSAAERPTHSTAEAKRAKKRQDGMFARLFAAEAALPTEDTISAPSDSPAAAASPRAGSPKADSGGCEGEQERQPESLGPDEVPNSASLEAEPAPALAAIPAPSVIQQHMQLPHAAVGTAFNKHLQDEVLRTSSAEAAPAGCAGMAAEAEARPVRPAAPAGPGVRRVELAEAARETPSQALIQNDAGGPPSAETPSAASGQVCSGSDTLLQILLVPE